MSKHENGGPAFPHTLPGHNIERGMTLRDYFAAKALQGICASGPGIEWTSRRLAQEAYELADAMMQARAPSQITESKHD